MQSKTGKMLTRYRRLLYLKETQKRVKLLPKVQVIHLKRLRLRLAKMKKMFLKTAIKLNRQLEMVSKM